MGESNIPMHALIFWCGWETNSIHTIFSYLFTSLSNNIRCGKTLSNWFFKHRMIFMGAPLQVFTISKQNPNWWFWFFMNSLSTECTSHKKKFKRILAANVLRFHGSFLEIIGNEPSGKYKDPTHHNFHHRIISVLVDTKKFNWDLSQMARWSHCRF